MVRRRGVLYVVCPKNPRHKQRQGFYTEVEGAAACCAPLGGAAPLVPGGMFGTGRTVGGFTMGGRFFSGGGAGGAHV